MEKSYPGMEMQPTNVTVVAPPQVFGKEPTQVTCGNCKNVVVTTTTYQDGGCVYMSAILLFCFFLPFTFVPFITYQCKDVTHYCPTCKARLGTYKRL